MYVPSALYQKNIKDYQNSNKTLTKNIEILVSIKGEKKGFFLKKDKKLSHNPNEL